MDKRRQFVQRHTAKTLVWEMGMGEEGEELAYHRVPVAITIRQHRVIEDNLWQSTGSIISSIARAGNTTSPQLHCLHQKEGLQRDKVLHNGDERQAMPIRGIQDE
jgi:hypothetical protein